MRAYQRIIEPKFYEASFNCPHCGTLAQQLWYRISGYDENAEERTFEGYAFSECQSCENPSLWTYSPKNFVATGDPPKFMPMAHRLVYPSGESGPLAHPEMPESVAILFNEAASILQLSPRASAALARMSLEELCKELGAKKRRLVDRIEELIIAKKLDVDTQAILTIVRCYGNDAVHNGGEILAAEDSTDAAILLELMNDLVERLIAIPARTAAMLARVPEAQRSRVIEHSDL